MKEIKTFEELNEKWSFLCEGIDNYDVRKATMQVLENSANYMVEQNYTTEAVMDELFEATANPNQSPADGNGAIGDAVNGKVASYVVPKVMLPVIRRVMPQLIAHELVSVQPIQGKTGVIFYAEYQYSDSKAGITAGDRFTGNYPQDGTGDASKRHAYYSSQKLGGVVVTATSATAFEDADGNAYISDAFAKTTGMTYLGAEFYPVEGGQVITFPGTAVSCSTAGQITVTVSGLTSGKDYLVFVKYQQEASAEIPEMQFQILSMPVQTVERKLKVRFTREAMQDLKAHFSMDLDAELVKMATVEMNYEVDREIIQTIDRAVPAALSYSHNWNFNGTDPVYNFLDRHRALAQSIFTLAGKMAQYNRQGAANWAVISPKVAAVLSMLPEFTKEPVTTNTNIYTIGSMNKIKYYVDPNRVGADENTILLGFKSPISTFGAGIVYSPYANWMTPSIFDPNTFDENKGFFSRYAITLAPRGEWFYAKLQITNLP